MKFWLRLLILWLLLGSGLRCLFLWFYPAGATEPGVFGFVTGIANDLQSFFVAAGLIALFGLGGQLWLRTAASLVIAVMLLVGIAEGFFWFEFESRLDRLVFHYLAYPKEVLVFLEDQLYLSLFVVPFVVTVWLMMRILSWPQRGAGSTLVHFGLILAGLAAWLFAQPLGLSNSRVASEFASNGYLGVMAAVRYRADDVAWLGQADVVPGKADAPQTDVAQAVRQELGSKRHVVLIIEESFAGPVWEDVVLRGRYMPNFSKLAQSSVSFSHLYATGSRTTRGLEAILNGFPPLPGISTTERHGFERLPSLARGMADGGYYPVFLYGGWPEFSNFSNYWQASGYREIWTREDFNENFETSWGVADGALFDRLLGEMSQLTQAHDSVFLTTLTVSHHRPYDFPDDKVDFPASARISEYAMAYADQALGDFFTAARKLSWFTDTLFVVVADHGFHAQGDALIPVGSYRIPMLLHAAGLQPREMVGLGSSMSIPRTLMSLLQIQTEELFAGQDLLCECDTVVPVEYGYHIGLLERDVLRVVRADGGYTSWVFDSVANRPGRVIDIVEEDAAKRVISVFAPAYQWFYNVP